MPKTRYEYEQQHKADAERIAELEYEVKNLKNELFYYQNVHKQVYEHKGGRTTKLTPDVQKNIRQQRAEGKSQRDIASVLGLSLGLVNKACKEISKGSTSIPRLQ